MSNYMQAMGETGWTTQSGVCRPKDEIAFGRFKDLQNQLNRLAVKKGLPKINVDGRIGPKTVALYSKTVAPGFDTCDQLAGIAVTGQATSLAMAAALVAGAPVSVSPPPTSRPSKYNPKTDKMEDPPGLAITDMLFNLFDGPMGLILLAGGGYLAYKKFGKKKAA